MSHNFSKKRTRIKSAQGRKQGSHFSNLGLGGTSGARWPSQTYVKKGSRTVLREKQHRLESNRPETKRGHWCLSNLRVPLWNALNLFEVSDFVSFGIWNSRVAELYAENVKKTKRRKKLKIFCQLLVELLLLRMCSPLLLPDSFPPPVVSSAAETMDKWSETVVLDNDIIEKMTCTKHVRNLWRVPFNLLLLCRPQYLKPTTRQWISNEAMADRVFKARSDLPFWHLRPIGDPCFPGDWLIMWQPHLRFLPSILYA